MRKAVAQETSLKIEFEAKTTVFKGVVSLVTLPSSLLEQT
jgi:hypothetical protein